MSITGNSFKLNSKALVLGAISAGVMSYASSMIDSSLGLDKLAKTEKISLTQQVQKGVANTVVKSGVNSALYGTDFKDNLKSNLGSTVQANLSSYIGENYLNKDIKYLKHKGLHALSGAVGSAIAGNDIESGALGAVTGEVIGEAVGNNLTDKNFYTDEEKDIIRFSSKLGTIMTAGISGKNVEIAYNSSNIAVENNVILHAPGTFASKKDVEESFKDGLKDFYKDKNLIVIDNGRDLENNDADRQKLADKIVDKIVAIKQENPNEPIYLSGHSNGGNVEKIVTNKLVEKGYKNVVDGMMLLAVPTFHKYTINNDVLTSQAKIINAYDKDDRVQSYISAFSSDDISIPKQIIQNNPKVQNIQVESPPVLYKDNFSGIVYQYYKNPFSDHVNIDSKPVIEQIKESVSHD
ncbi:MAG: DUF637 domain-containing protein [Arcobacter sp.]|uniref:DUF637 domain-containing protein n=1 Tax=Arcobacter sp. TaxID=1872629 RepID=UPI003AFF9FF3